MRIYRIQDANNLGPMHYLSPIRRNVRYHKDPGEMQGKQNGKLVNPQIVGSAARFAWNSLDEICQFIKFPRAVDEAGYTVVEYDVDASKCVLYPDGQVLFYPTDAVKVDEYPYSESVKRMFAQSRFP